MVDQPRASRSLLSSLDLLNWIICLLRTGIDYKFRVNQSHVDVHERLERISCDSLITMHPYMPLKAQMPTV